MGIEKCIILEIKTDMETFPKGGHLQLVYSFFLHHRCPVIGENTVKVFSLNFFLIQSNLSSGHPI